MSEQNQEQSAEAVTTPSEKEQEEIVGGYQTRPNPNLEADPEHFHALLVNRNPKPVLAEIARK